MIFCKESLLKKRFGHGHYLQRSDFGTFLLFKNYYAFYQQQYFFQLFE